MADIKNFLYAWCGKRKVTPNYDVRATGNKNRQKFTCEVRVEGFNYTAMGNSTNKKDAQANAARDYVNYLVRIGEVKASEVPALGTSMPGADVSIDPGGGRGFGTLPPNAPLPPHLAVKNEADVEPGPSSGPVPGVTGLGYSNFSGAQWERGVNLNDYYSKREEQEAQATLESEEVDLNASLHGNWTLENAKARLNQFFQKEKNQADYKYSQVGLDHNSVPQNKSTQISKMNQMEQDKNLQQVIYFILSIYNFLKLPLILCKRSTTTKLSSSEVQQAVLDEFIKSGKASDCNVVTQTDFLMVVLRDVVQAFPEIRIILMSAAIDTTMFREYYFNCPVIEVFGRTFPVQEYFLEDSIQMTQFVPSPSERKKKDKDEEGGEEETNFNIICGPEYGPETKRSMAQINEKETPFELIEALLKYIETLKVPGAVLVFLPGHTLMFNSVGPDNNLDVVISLLAFGAYPNVCYHKEKRKILTTEGRNALIHKSSVNCLFSSQDLKYPSPFFVFSEKNVYSTKKIQRSGTVFYGVLTTNSDLNICTTFHIHIRTRAISAKGMTLVSALQLLLFASKKVTSDGEIILLDEWIKLKMSHNVAACTTALRTGMEAVVVEVSKDPEDIRQMDPINQRMLNIIRQISKPSATGLNLMVNNSRFADGPRPPKMPRFAGGAGYRGRGGYHGGGMEVVATGDRTIVATEGEEEDIGVGMEVVFKKQYAKDKCSFL
ncbi:ATP-dependent RNA helicase A protein-like [Acipenser ruthenus]|uniref:ATP-dependent RNA helicase A protein-like n=1 Tax=Acipenser ruthenus TaxID=7906 RepID=UPI00274295B5|nr:ATP-dependent RNA helicase A protein-like [Acipenser ruthenus]